MGSGVVTAPKEPSHCLQGLSLHRTDTRLSVLSYERSLVTLPACRQRGQRTESPHWPQSRRHFAQKDSAQEEARQASTLGAWWQTEQARVVAALAVTKRPVDGGSCKLNIGSESHVSCQLLVPLVMLTSIDQSPVPHQCRFRLLCQCQNHWTYRDGRHTRKYRSADCLLDLVGRVRRHAFVHLRVRHVSPQLLVHVFLFVEA